MNNLREALEEIRYNVENVGSLKVEIEHLKADKVQLRGVINDLLAYNEENCNKVTWHISRERLKAITTLKETR